MTSDRVKAEPLSPRQIREHHLPYLNRARRADRTVPDLVEGNVHVEQVSVHPSHARRGVGRALLEHVAGQAKIEAVPALTLTTFREVPWNAPYYLRCGFRYLDEAELTPGLRLVRHREAAHGLDRWPRVCMRRDLA